MALSRFHSSVSTLHLTVMFSLEVTVIHGYHGCNTGCSRKDDLHLLMQHLYSIIIVGELVEFTFVRYYGCKEQQSRDHDDLIELIVD